LTGIIDTLLASRFYDLDVVQIEQAGPEDYEAICDLVVLLNLISERSRITNTFEGSTYWVARTDARVVGCVGLEHGIGASLLRSAAVHPDYQGQGIGDQLARTAINAARTRADKFVYLFSTDAGDYWQRYGFAEVDVWTLANALPESPQVRSGVERGWITDERAWKRCL
jgi:N-acetylglutamate synthase-like GNAT family acetyltransferase